MPSHEEPLGAPTTPAGVAAAGGTQQEAAAAGTPAQVKPIIQRGLVTEESEAERTAQADVLQKLQGLNRGGFLNKLVASKVSKDLSQAAAAQQLQVRAPDELAPEARALAQQFVEGKISGIDLFRKLKTDFPDIDAAQLFQNVADATKGSTTPQAFTLKDLGPVDPETGETTDIFADLGGKGAIAAALGLSGEELDALSINELQAAVAAKTEEDFTRARNLRAKILSLPPGSAQREALTTTFNSLVTAGVTPEEREMGEAVRLLEAADKIQIGGQEIDIEELLESETIKDLIGKHLDDDPDALPEDDPVAKAIRDHVDKFKLGYASKIKNAKEARDKFLKIDLVEQGVKDSIGLVAGSLLPEGGFQTLKEAKDFQAENKALLQSLALIDEATQQFLVQDSRVLETMRQAAAGKIPGLKVEEIAQLLKSEEVRNSPDLIDAVLSGQLRDATQIDDVVTRRRISKAGRNGFISVIAEDVGMSPTALTEQWDELNSLVDLLPKDSRDKVIKARGILDPDGDGVINTDGVAFDKLKTGAISDAAQEIRKLLTQRGFIRGISVIRTVHAGVLSKEKPSFASLEASIRAIDRRGRVSAAFRIPELAKALSAKGLTAEGYREYVEDRDLSPALRQARASNQGTLNIRNQSLGPSIIDILTGKATDTNISDVDLGKLRQYRTKIKNRIGTEALNDVKRIDQIIQRVDDAKRRAAERARIAARPSINIERTAQSFSTAPGQLTSQVKSIFSDIASRFGF